MRWRISSSSATMTTIATTNASMIAPPPPTTGPPRFVYRLGKSLYVPLTSRCNSRTLPQTRGPNFVLPPSVVASLCRVRDVEMGKQQWEPWCQWLDTIDSPSQKLPIPLETIAQFSEQERDDDIAGKRRPTVEELFHEVESQLRLVSRYPKSDNPNNVSSASLVIAGEGEPLLRLPALTTLVKRIKNSSPSTQVRVITNGLILPDNSSTVAQQLLQCGVDSVSVALMTNDPHQYEEWMQPKLLENIDVTAHSYVCSFLRACLDAQLSVEVTAVQHPSVDSTRTEEFAASLGIVVPVRWRSYWS